MANEQQVVPIHTTIPIWQKTMVDQFAKDQGYLTFAEALRRVLTEWRSFRDAADGVRLTDQEQPA